MHTRQCLRLYAEKLYHCCNHLSAQADNIAAVFLDGMLNPQIFIMPLLNKLKQLMLGIEAFQLRLFLICASAS